MTPTARYKPVLDNLQAVATILAIFVGGVWTYLLFVQQRQRFPHLKMEHKISHLSLPEHRILLMVDVTHSNVGAIKINFSTADIRIYGLKRTPDLSGDVLKQLNRGRPPDEIEPTSIWTLLAQQSQNWKTDLFIEPGEGLFSARTHGVVTILQRLQGFGFVLVKLRDSAFHAGNRLLWSAVAQRLSVDILLNPFEVLGTQLIFWR